MKKLVLSLIAVGMIVGLSNELQAQTTANASSDAFATIVAPIAISHSGTDLQFGTIISGTGSGTVMVTTAGVRTFSSPALNPGDQGATPTAAVFTVTGQANYTYDITLPASDVTLTESVSSDTMTIAHATFTSDPAATAGNLGAGGSQAVNVGATLTVTASLSSGTYEGSFDVTVAYN